VPHVGGVGSPAPPTGIPDAGIPGGILDGGPPGSFFGGMREENSLRFPKNDGMWAQRGIPHPVNSPISPVAAQFISGCALLPAQAGADT
jgi:hypothetical protein